MESSKSYSDVLAEEKDSHSNTSEASHIRPAQAAGASSTSSDTRRPSISESRQPISPSQPPTTSPRPTRGHRRTSSTPPLPPLPPPTPRRPSQPSPPIGTLYLIRHAQALHNADGDLTHPDPPITLAGVSQCLNLRQSFPHKSNIGLIISSPLTRTLQTTLVTFADLLPSTLYENWTSPSQYPDIPDSPDNLTTKLGTSTNPIPLEIVPPLQERSNWPADTASPPDALLSAFPNLTTLVDPLLASISENNATPWWIHTHFYSTRPEHIRLRGIWCRRFFHRTLLALNGADLVVVTHGGFLKTLVQSESLEWGNCGWMGFRTVVAPNEEVGPLGGGDSEDVVLLEKVDEGMGVRDLREVVKEEGEGYMRLEGIEVIEEGEGTTEEIAEVEGKEGKGPAEVEEVEDKNEVPNKEGKKE